MDRYDAEQIRWEVLRDALLEQIAAVASELHPTASPAELEVDALRLETLAIELRYRAERMAALYVEQRSKIAAEREEVMDRIDSTTHTEDAATEYEWEIEDAKRAIRLLEEAGEAESCVRVASIPGRDLGVGSIPGEIQWLQDPTPGTNGRWLRVLREALDARERGEA